MNKLLVISLPVLLGLQGCSSIEPEAEQEVVAPAAPTRERVMHERWAGRDYQELIAELGPPVYEMTIPRYGWPNSRALLYGTDEESGCVDAFLIVKGDERTWVEDYYCR